MVGCVLCSAIAKQCGKRSVDECTYAHLYGSRAPGRNWLTVLKTTEGNIIDVDGKVVNAVSLVSERKIAIEKYGSVDAYRYLVRRALCVDVLDPIEICDEYVDGVAYYKQFDAVHFKRDVELLVEDLSGTKDIVVTGLVDGFIDPTTLGFLNDIRLESGRIFSVCTLGAYGNIVLSFPDHSCVLRDEVFVQSSGSGSYVVIVGDDDRDMSVYNRRSETVKVIAASDTAFAGTGATTVVKVAVPALNVDGMPLTLKSYVSSFETPIDIKLMLNADENDSWSPTLSAYLKLYKIICGDVAVIEKSLVSAFFNLLKTKSTLSKEELVKTTDHLFNKFRKFFRNALLYFIKYHTDVRVDRFFTMFVKEVDSMFFDKKYIVSSKKIGEILRLLSFYGVLMLDRSLDFSLYMTLLEKNRSDEIVGHIFDSLFLFKLYNVNLVLNDDRCSLLDKASLQRYVSDKWDNRFVCLFSYYHGNEPEKFVKKVVHQLGLIGNGNEFDYGLCYLNIFQVQHRYKMMKLMNFFPVLFNELITHRFVCKRYRSLISERLDVKSVVYRVDINGVYHYTADTEYKKHGQLDVRVEYRKLTEQFATR